MTASATKQPISCVTIEGKIYYPVNNRWSENVATTTKAGELLDRYNLCIIPSPYFALSIPSEAERKMIRDRICFPDVVRQYLIKIGQYEIK